MSYVLCFRVEGLGLGLTRKAIVVDRDDCFDVLIQHLPRREQHVHLRLDQRKRFEMDTREQKML